MTAGGVVPDGDGGLFAGWYYVSSLAAFEALYASPPAWEANHLYQPGALIFESGVYFGRYPDYHRESDSSIPDFASVGSEGGFIGDGDGYWMRLGDAFDPSALDTWIAENVYARFTGSDEILYIEVDGNVFCIDNNGGETFADMPDFSTVPCAGIDTFAENGGDLYFLWYPYVPGSISVTVNGTPGTLSEDDPPNGAVTLITGVSSDDIIQWTYTPDTDACSGSGGPGLWAQFDGSTWEKLPVMDWHVQRGVSGDLAGGSSPGSGIFTIQNPADRYNPENAASPLYGLLNDGVRVWCGVNEDGTVNDGKTVLGVFAGHLSDIEPMPVGGASVSPTVVLTCADPLEWMGRQPVRLADSTSRSQSDLRSEVLTAIGWAYGTDLPVEPTTLPLSSADGLAGNVLDSLNRANGTRHYIKPADTFTDWCTYTAVRRTSLLDANSLASMDAGSEHITGTSGWRRSADGVINQQQATVTPISFPGRVLAWRPDLLPFTVTGELVIWVEFPDYVGGPLIDIDSTGDALTTDIEPFGSTAKVTLTSAGVSVVTDLDITGYLVQRGATASVVIDDTGSQAGVRGVRAGSELSGDYLGTLTSAHGIAAHIVYRFAQPLGRPTVAIVNWLPEQYERDVLQLVDVTVAELAISARVYEIVGLTHVSDLAAVDADDNPVVSHNTTLVLQESREQTDPGWFILGSSLLGGPDVLAY